MLDYCIPESKPKASSAYRLMMSPLPAGLRGALVAGLSGRSSHQPSETPQDLVLSKSSRLENNSRDVNPAAGSGNGIPRRSRGAVGRAVFRKTSIVETATHHLAVDPAGNRSADPTISNPPLLNN